MTAFTANVILSGGAYGDKGPPPLIKVSLRTGLGVDAWVFVHIDDDITVSARRPADLAALRDAFAGAYHQLVGELVARGEWVECDRCGEACAKEAASFPHTGPDEFGNYDLLGTLCPSCAPDDDAGRTFGLPLAEYVPVPGDAAPEPF